MDASGKPVFYEYDWRGKLPAVKDRNGETLAAYAHTPGERLKEIRHGNRTLKSGSRIGGEGKATEHTMSLTLAKSEGNRIRHVMPESYDPQTDDGEGFTYTYDAFSFSKDVLIALTNV